MKWVLICIILVGSGYHKLMMKKSELCERNLEERVRVEEQRLAQAKQEALIPKRSTQLICSPASISVLRTLTQDVYEQNRLASLDLLWRLQDSQSPQMIRTMFETETDSSIKMAMIDTIAKDKSVQGLSLITLGLRDYDKSVRLKAVQAIGSYLCKEAIPLLAPAAQDDEPDVRRKAIDAANLIRQALQTGKGQVLNTTEFTPIYLTD